LPQLRALPVARAQTSPADEYPNRKHSMSHTTDSRAASATQASSSESGQTHFGYKNIPAAEKERRVADVFHSVASKYDLMNDLMSVGVHRLWKRFTIESSGVRKGHKVLDIAGGTGDLTMKFADIVGESGKVVLADINASMLNVGRDRLLDKGYGKNIEFVQANAECLPFPDNYFDCVSIAFGLRNVTDKDKAIASMLRVLRPGGKLLILEFSKPVLPLISKIYDLYSFSALPLMGKIIAGDSDSYQYLAESIRMHPDQETLKGMMENAGFARCKYYNMTAGIVALHSGIKP
jgi:demethylmenaquinone methyltransferase/2-methoxy-6-polyprenyl-1,4-benzoquinol methylase